MAPRFVNYLLAAMSLESRSYAMPSTSELMSWFLMMRSEGLKYSFTLIHLRDEKVRLTILLPERDLNLTLYHVP